MIHSLLRLKKNEEKRLRRGHLWIFSNEVDTTQTPLSGFASGDLTDVVDSSGHPLGTAFINPHSLICARLLSRKPSLAIGPGFFRDRIRSALALRQQLFEKPYYRLVYGESDGLPGVVIDRFDDIFSVQLTTAGMDRRKNEIVAALD
ncbi:MAG: RlmI/RlmK family 23S rRNA methyltransferase, partial [Pseudomonadota bacterium]